MPRIVPVAVPFDGGLNDWPDETLIKPNQAAEMRDCWVRHRRLRRKPGRVPSDPTTGDPIFSVFEMVWPTGERTLNTIRQASDGSYHVDLEEKTYDWPLLVCVGSSYGKGIASRSFDGGRIWITEEINAVSALLKVIRLATGEFLAIANPAGASTYVYKSTDNGNSWAGTELTGWYGAADIIQLASGRVLISLIEGPTDDFYVAKSDDQGANWAYTLVKGTIAGGAAGGLIQDTTTGNVITVVEGGAFVRYSTDDGDTWPVPSVVPTETVAGFAETNGTVVWADGLTSTDIFYTADGGDYWTAKSTTYDFAPPAGGTGGMLSPVGNHMLVVCGVSIYRCTDLTAATPSFTRVMVSAGSALGQIIQPDTNLGDLLVPFTNATEKDPKLYISRDWGATWSLYALNVLGLSADAIVYGVAAIG